MMQQRRASVIAPLSLLASAAKGSAECARVFWLEAGDVQTHESSSRPVSGWGTREACEQALTLVELQSAKLTQLLELFSRDMGRMFTLLRLLAERDVISRAEVARGALAMEDHVTTDAELSQEPEFIAWRALRRKLREMQGEPPPHEE
jgi:hypothetical protein